jgi:serine/threonine protein kinase
MVTFCDELLKAAHDSEIIRDACDACKQAIGQYRVGASQDLCLIVESATRDLQKALCPNSASKTATRPKKRPRSLHKAASPEEIALPSKNSPMSTSEWVSSHRIARPPTDILKDRKAVKASSKVLNGDRPRFGPVHEVTVTGDSSRFIGKYFHYFEDSERRSSQYRDMMKRFCTLNHPCLSPIIYCCDPLPKNGPILVSHFYARGSLQSILEVPIGKSRLTSTKKSMLICELVCGLFYLHCEGIVHGELTPRKFLLDDDLHLHISGFAISSLLDARVIYSQNALGTCSPQYAAPELFDRTDSSNSSLERQSKIDVYALGFIIYELFGNAKWAEGLSQAEFERRARENVRPALPEGINVRLGEFICRCWDSDPDKRPTIDEVLRDMASMHFQFVPDVDCESVLKRALAISLSDLITASLAGPIPAFQGIRFPDPGTVGPGVPARLSFLRVVRMLIDYC